MNYVPNPPPLHDFVLVVGGDAASNVPDFTDHLRSIPGVVASPINGCLLLRPEGAAPEADPDGPVHFFVRPIDADRFFGDLGRYCALSANPNPSETVSYASAGG